MKSYSHIIITGIIMLLLIVIILPSFINILMGRDLYSAFTTFKVTFLFYVFPLIAVFTINYFVLAPHFYDKKQKILFWLLNIMLIGLCNYFLLSFNPKSLPRVVQEGYYSYMVILIFINFLMAVFALGVRHVVRSNKIQERLKEEKQKNTEAELYWLKNQLNPHFLFNTLNNISSLTYIDANEAQEKIAQLSDLLRYALYLSNNKQVSLAGEIEFMKNYIELMKMRCNEKTTIDVCFDKPDKADTIAPLLFISPIENAFKHGVSGSVNSFIRIGMKLADNRIVFVCDNSNIPKDNKDHSGSGIGLDNLRRRLELIYPNRYTYEQNITNDIYHVEITIKQ